nr:hypothetical protein [Tanacetum cinerariifolium]
MFRINPFKNSREEKHVPNTVKASNRIKPITVSQPPVFTRKDVNFDSNGLSSTGVDNTKTRRPQPSSNTQNDRVPSVSKSSQSKNKEAKIEEHHRNLLLFKNNKHMSSACNNIKLDSHNVISKVVCAMYVEPIVPRLRNIRDAHLDYLTHLKESVETIRDIVEEAKVVRTLDRSIVSARRYTKNSQELFEYAIGTCPQGSQKRDKQLAQFPLIRKKQVTFAKPSDKSNSNTHKHVAKVKTQKTNVFVPPSTGVNSCPNARES